MTTFPITEVNQVHRLAKRAAYDAGTIYGIIDAAPICHAAFVADSRPVVLPTIHARVGDRIYLHGAPSSRLLKLAGSGGELCLSFTLLDGLVLARSVFHSSMNYRSAVVFGHGRIVDARDAKRAALDAIVDHVMPGRSGDARPPSDIELNGTLVVEVAIEAASAKVREGPAGDDEEDYALSVWAGVVPLRLSASEPVSDERLQSDVALPDYVRAYVDKSRKSITHD